MTTPKRPKDFMQRAKLIADIALGQETEPPIYKGKNEKNTKRAIKAGLVGGINRAKSLTAKRRKEIAKKAAAARWKKTSK